jgi:hypothetical protein
MTKFGLAFLALMLVAAMAGFMRPKGLEFTAPNVAANQRLTALTGVPLYALLLAIAVTILFIRPLLIEHYLIGFLLIPPVLLKLASTGYKFTRYYLGHSAYRLAGTPPLLLRFVVAPTLVISTAAVFGTGLELWAFGLRFGSAWISAHTLSAVVFVIAAALHLIGHSRQSAALSIARDEVNVRSFVVGSLVLGAVLAVTSLLYASPFPSSSAGG